MSHGKRAVGVVVLGAGAGLVSVGYRTGLFVLAIAGSTLAAFGLLLLWIGGEQ